MANGLDPTAAAFVLPSPSKRLYTPSHPAGLKTDPQKKRARECRPTPILLHPLPPKPPVSAVPLSIRCQGVTSDGPSETSSSRSRSSLSPISDAVPSTSPGRKSPPEVPNAAPRTTRRSRKWTWQPHRNSPCRVPPEPTPSHALETFLTPKSKERMSKEVANPTTSEAFRQDKGAVDKLPKRPLRGRQHQWTSRRHAESENYRRFRWGSSTLNLTCSPFIPKNLKEFLKHKEEYSKDQVARYKLIIAKHDPQAPKVGVECMGGKTFETCGGVVLAVPTIWSSSRLTMPQIKSDWPCIAELKEEGHNRTLQGYHRRFPLPRAKEFDADTLFPYPSHRNQLGEKYAVWNHEEQLQHQEEQFALALNQLDLVGGMWKENDEEETYDGSDEFETKAEADLLGLELSGMLGCFVVSSANEDEVQAEGCFERIGGGREQELGREDSS